ncbi:hypothetical protein [Alteromonas sp. H39]|uniref:hypothetical protein n=1 Tax=Alteromonas sp. H39 TaxID=3389876 RepID=UPI0039E0B3C2
MLNNNNERTRARARRSARKAAAKKRRNTALLILLGLTSVSAIAAMFGATPAGRYVAGLMKDNMSQLFAEPTSEPTPGQSAESLHRNGVSEDAEQLVTADRTAINPLALPLLKDTYPEGDTDNWNVNTLISRKRAPEDSSVTDPMNPEHYGLGDQDGGTLSSASLWAAVSFQGDTGNFFNTAARTLRSEQSGPGFGQIGALSAGGIIPAGNPGDNLNLYAIGQSGTAESGINNPLVDVAGPSGINNDNTNQQGNRLPTPLPLFKVADIAPNDEPLTQPASEGQQETVNADTTNNGSIEVSEPATLAIFAFAALYLFGLRRALTRRPVLTERVSV